MDKLNIPNSGNYPLCLETLKVLYDNATVVNRMMSRLNLANNTAVILSESEHNGNYEGVAYIYTEDGDRIVKYSRADGVSTDSAKMNITTIDNDVSSVSETYFSSYTTEIVTIVSENTAANQWKFYELNEVLEPAIFEDKLGDVSYGGKSQGLTFNSNPSIFGDNNIFSRNSNRLRIRLKISVSASTFTSSDYFYFNVDSDADHFHIIVISNSTLGYQAIHKPIQTEDIYPLKSFMKVGENVYDIVSYLYNGKIYFKIGKMALTNLVPENDVYSANGTIYVNGEVLL